MGIKDSTFSVSHYVYSAPYDWEFVSHTMKNKCIRLSRDEHRLKWSDGLRSYVKLSTDLQSLDGAIWTLGEEKSMFLSEILAKDVYNLEDLGSTYSAAREFCALKNALLYCSWLRPKFCSHLRIEGQCEWHALETCDFSSCDDLRTGATGGSEGHQHGLWSGPETERRQRCPATTKRVSSKLSSCRLPPRLAPSAYQADARTSSDSPTLPYWTTEHLWGQSLRGRQQGCSALRGYAASQSSISTASTSSTFH